MQLVTEFALPALIMLAMTIVGLELTLADLRRALQYPGEVGVSLLAQLIGLPLIAAALVVVLRPDPAVAGGLILVATAPQAIMSNYFCLLARANVALSVTLTGVSSLLAVVSTPLLAGFAFDLLLDQQAGFALPVAKVMQQVVSGLLLPIAAGMLVRWRAPAFVARYRRRFQRVSLAALALMLAVIVANQAATIQRHFVSLVLTAALFTLGALGLGAGVAAVSARARADRATLVAAFPARSLGIATLVAVNVLGRLEFLSFAVVFFAAQALFIVPAMLGMRERGAEQATVQQAQPARDPRITRS